MVQVDIDPEYKGKPEASATLPSSGVILDRSPRHDNASGEIDPRENPFGYLWNTADGNRAVLPTEKGYIVITKHEEHNGSEFVKNLHIPRHVSIELKPEANGWRRDAEYKIGENGLLGYYQSPYAAELPIGRPFTEAAAEANRGEFAHDRAVHLALHVQSAQAATPPQNA